MWKETIFVSMLVRLWPFLNITFYWYDIVQKIVACNVLRRAVSYMWELISVLRVSFTRTAATFVLVA